MILFVSLGTAAVSNIFDMDETGAAEEGKKSISIVKFVDAVIRLAVVTIVFFLSRLENKLVTFWVGSRHGRDN